MGQPNKHGSSSRRNPDDDNNYDNDRDDGEDNDEDNDSRPPSIDRYQLLLGNNTQWSPTKTSSKKPGAKLPSLHPRQLYWSGERAKLRPFIQRWYDHLSGFQDYPALMFLQQCVPPNYKKTVLNSTSLVACLKKLATHCANEKMYCM